MAPSRPRPCLTRRNLRGMLGAFRNRGRGEGQRFRGTARQAFEIAPAQQEQKGLGLVDQTRQVAIARRLAGLAPQPLQLAFDLRDDVGQAAEIGFGGLQAQLRLMAALVQAGNAGGLFEDGAARERLLIDQDGDLALAHQSRRSGAGGSIGKENLHVALTHLAAIDAVGRTRVPLDPPRDLHRFGFIVGRGRAAVAVFDEQRHFGIVAHRARTGAAEYDVVHSRPAHRGRAVFAHHPAKRFQQIGFAAAIGPDNAGQPGLDEEFRRVDEGFEAAESKTGELQCFFPVTPAVRASTSSPGDREFSEARRREFRPHAECR